MTKQVNFIFENFKYDSLKSFQQNLYSGNFSNFSNCSFCRPSQVLETIGLFESILDIKLNLFGINENIKNYIISTAVLYSPDQWTDKNSNESVFELLDTKFLHDLQNNNALLLIDQSVEGYHSKWLWQWFHDKCNQYKINPKSIIFLTGNQKAEDQYIKWCLLSNKTTSKIKVIPSVSLSYYIFQTYKRSNLNITFDKLISLKNNNTKLFNCTNLRPRDHRVINFLHLVKSNLVNDGLISISSSAEWLVSDLQFKKYNMSQEDINNAKNLAPLTICHKQSLKTDYVSYITRILDDVYENSWVSLITESSFFDYEESIFISEKTFKAIACMHPFIIVGSRHSLKYLKKLGYKTFEGFIDESYDECEDEYRFEAIINSLNKIKEIEDKVSWYRSMKEILEYNQQLFLSIETKKQVEHEKIINYYSEYFSL